ncbi:uncharacterized protein FMAN_14305 [Fusarium mangiferae]|uniref:Uncharacterized protein n=1 Tax=Fusarium mangiferae TaxID=192010 RepID=A0A1L7ULY2_FUSMA|nr:uncharacterized protein FMAN_14305 [Fusarium mangiferae]CVL09483.1 uncharacterized protein FMAN_14305 [Fusarium mangiferae]
MTTRRNPPKALKGMKFWLSESARGVEGLEIKIHHHGGKIYKNLQEEIYVVCLPDERQELWRFPDGKKSSPVRRAYQTGKTFVETTSFNSLTNGIESWKPTEFIPPVSSKKTERNNSVSVESKSPLTLDTISVSDTSTPKENEESRTERSTTPNISKVLPPTETAVEERASLSNSTVEGLEDVQERLQDIRAVLVNQSVRTAAENRSCVQAIDYIIKVMKRIEVVPE